jgi:peptidoglycan/LPS O-acetylase OafA/YrhL
MPSLSHVAVIWILSQVMRVILKKPEVIIGGRSTPQLSSFKVVLACVATASIVLGISTLVYRFIETPMRDRSRRFAARHMG